METASVQNIDDLLKAAAQDSSKIADIDRSVLSDYIDSITELLNIGKLTLKSLTPDIRKRLGEKIQSSQAQIATTPGAYIYMAYLKQLKGEALETEKREFLSSLENAVDVYSGLLAEVSKNLNNLFANQKISIANSKVSHAIALGLVSKSLDMGRWTIYLINALISDGVKLLDVPKYRVKFLDDKLSSIVDNVLDVYGRVGPLADINKIKAMRNSGKDIKLVSDNGNPNTSVIVTETAMDPSTSLTFKKGLMIYNPFRFIGEKWNLLKHWFTENNVKNKEWMEAHVALLKLELDNVPENSPEYIRLVKIIHEYEQRIIRLEERINQYYGEA